MNVFAVVMSSALLMCNAPAKAFCNSGATSPKNADICPGQALATSGWIRQWASVCASSFLLYGAFTVVRTDAGNLLMTFTVSTYIQAAGHTLKMAWRGTKSTAWRPVVNKA